VYVLPGKERKAINFVSKDAFCVVIGFNKHTATVKPRNFPFNIEVPLERIRPAMLRLIAEPLYDQDLELSQPARAFFATAK
jgi:hypothetical protein